MARSATAKNAPGPAVAAVTPQRAKGAISARGERNCSVARTLDIVSDAWAFLIIREAFFGTRTFEAFRSALDIPRATLKLLAYAREHIAHYKCPRSIDFEVELRVVVAEQVGHGRPGIVGEIVGVPGQHERGLRRRLKGPAQGARRCLVTGENHRRNLVAELDEIAASAQQAAVRDPLTGLVNRSGLSLLGQQMDKATLIRSMSYTPAGLFNHTAAIYQIMTGYTTDKVSPSGQLEPPSPKDFPNFGSNIIRLKPPTPRGMASGSFGPTTAGRMDGYVDVFQSNGGSMVMIAKGNRGPQVTAACKKHGGFYLGSIGGPAARLAQDCITKVEVLEMPELGMEAVWKIEVENFPAFIVVDDKGNDFFKELNLG